MLQIQVNGKTHSFQTALTVTQLIEQLEMSGRRIAVERNGMIVPKSQHQQTTLQDGDHIEIVVAVGGG